MLARSMTRIPSVTVQEGAARQSIKLQQSSNSRFTQFPSARLSANNSRNASSSEIPASHP